MRVRSATASFKMNSSFYLFYVPAVLLSGNWFNKDTSEGMRGVRISSDSAADLIQLQRSNAHPSISLYPAWANSGLHGSRTSWAKAEETIWTGSPVHHRTNRDSHTNFNQWTILQSVNHKNRFRTVWPNLHMHRKNMQTVHRKAPKPGLKLWWEWLTTAPLHGKKPQSCKTGTIQTFNDDIIFSRPLQPADCFI